MAMSNAERQRRYRQRHQSNGGRLNFVVDAHAKVVLQRLATCYGVTLREALEQALDQTEIRLLDALDAGERKRYYAGELSLRRNGDDADQAEDPPASSSAPEDRDQTIMAMVEAGESFRGIGRKLGIAESTIRGIVKRHRQKATA